MIVVAAGPAIYLLGHVLFRLVMAGSISVEAPGGRGRVRRAPARLGTAVPALALAALLVGVLVAVIGAEQLAAARRRARGEPSPLERLDGSAGA